MYQMYLNSTYLVFDFILKREHQTDHPTQHYKTEAYFIFIDLTKFLKGVLKQSFLHTVWNFTEIYSHTFFAKLHVTFAR